MGLANLLGTTAARITVLGARSASSRAFRRTRRSLCRFLRRAQRRRYTGDCTRHSSFRDWEDGRLYFRAFCRTDRHVEPLRGRRFSISSGPRTDRPVGRGGAGGRYRNRHCHNSRYIGLGRFFLVDYHPRAFLFGRGGRSTGTPLAGHVRRLDTRRCRAQSLFH